MNPLRQLTLEDLRGRKSAKWRAHPDDVLPLWVAEMDVPLAEPVAAALHEAVDRGDMGYPVQEQYVDAAAGFAKQRWDFAFDTETARLVPDVMHGITEVITRQRAEAVVVNPPVYPPFFEFLEHIGRRIIEAPLGADGRLDLGVVERAFEDAPRGRTTYLLCSPHNPTGTVHTVAELEAVAALAKEHGVRVVADEIHAPLVYDGSYRPYLTIDGSADAVSLMSASKAWNLAGVKAAIAIPGPEAADDVVGLPFLVSMGATHAGVVAHAAAYTHGQPWLEDLLAGLDENRRLLADLLAERLPEIGYRIPQGTYLAWLDCRAIPSLGDDPAGVFLERGRVALNSGLAFGTGGAGFARLNLATHPDILTEAVRRMAAAV